MAGAREQPPTAAEWTHLSASLHDRCETIAGRWYRAVARTGFVALGAPATRQRLRELAHRAIDVLLAEPFDGAGGRVLGETLAALYYGHPDALSRTQEILARELIADLPAEQIVALQPRLAGLFGELAAGFLGRARDTILVEQEAIRGALLAARQQAEEESRASQARFRAVFDAAAIGIGIGDIEGRILDSNPALEAMFGYSAAEFRQLVVAQFMHPEDAASVWGLYEQLIFGDRDYFDAEKRFYRKDGRLVWTHLTVSLVRDATGAPQFQIAMLENITERKQAEETIKQLNVDLERRVSERTAQLTALNQDLASEVARRTQAEAGRLQLLIQEQAAGAEAEAARQRLAFLAEASAALTSALDYRTTLASIARLAVPYLADWCAVDVVAEDGTLQRLAVSHVDLAKVEFVRALQDYQPPDPDALSGVLRVLRTGRAELLGEMDEALRAAVAGGTEQQRILGELRPVSRITVPLTARQRTLGTITFVLAESGRRFTPTELTLAEDLARRAAIAVDNARLYQEAQRALAARDEFLSVAAHELKTPITNVRGFTELALQQFTRAAGPDLPRVERSLRVLNRESQRLTHLVTQLLDISRIEAGKLELARAVSDVAALVREVAASAQLSTKQHTIMVQAPASVPALVDPLRLEQVVANLVSNAIKYSPQGGPIAVEVATPTAEMVRIAVRDWGVGITPERRPRLFERYYQTRAGDRVAGMGLGLYISRQIVEAHGGRIAAASPPDGGTRMLVDLPTGQAGREDDEGT